MANFGLLTVTRVFTSSTSQPAPAGLVGTARAQLWASACGGGGATSTAASTGGGAGGAGYSEEPALAISGGFVITLPAGGAGGTGSVGSQGGNPGDSSIVGDSVTVLAHPGSPGTCSNSNGALGAGAAASSNTIAFGGGNGSSGVASGHGGAGGGGAGSGGAGGAASITTGGAAGTPDGGAGAAGQSTANTAGNPGSSPTGGGGGAKGGAVRSGGAGGTGKAIVTYQVLVPLGQDSNYGRPSLRRGGSQVSPGAPFTPVGPPVPSPFMQPQVPQRGAKLLRPGGHARSKGAPYSPPPPVVVSKFHQPGPVRSHPSTRRGGSRRAAGTPVVPFPAQQVNQWAGTVTHSPQWGDSLPGIASCVVDLTPANSVGGGTGTPTAGNWLFVLVGWNAAAGAATVNVGCDTHQWWRPAVPSNAAGLTRTTIWYQPNIIPPTAVYVAPSAYMDGMSVLVVEVGGLGPWDQVTALFGNYAAAATSLSLVAGAPGASAFMIAAVTGDSATAGTALTPPGWTPLSTVTATNGVDSSSDTVLASASITTNLAQVITGTATSAEDMSGMIISVLETAPSPVPGGINMAWPYLICEAAWGSGYMTAPDQMTWVNLQTQSNGSLLRAWSEATGVQYELDELESTEASAVLDNPSGAVSPANPSSPWFPNVVPGTPIRIRAITPAANRWYVIQRNVERWPQTWDEVLRGIANTVITDLWSVINRELPTPYRAEVLNDLPYAWWPCDDPATNNPVTLVNAAPGNSNPLQITVAPGGLASSVTVPGGGSGGSVVFLFSAVEAFAADASWMYGDPDSASWQQTGTGTVSTGRYLTCTDVNFPPLANGVTVEGWWNYTFFRTAPPNANIQFGPNGQPGANIVLWELNTGSAVVAQLFIDSSGHLHFTIGGSSTTIWSGSDLRNTTWFGATVTMTTTAWTVWLNGGIVAKVSGSTSATSVWSVFTANATAGGTAGIGNPEVSHLAIYPTVLPAARVMAHFLAAYTAFGQLPQPTGLTQQFIPTTTTGPDGNTHTSTFFEPPTSFLGTNSTLAAYVTGAAGSFSESGTVVPESWNWCQSTGSGSGAAGDYGWLTATGPATPTFRWYTAGGAGNEKLASTSVENYLFVGGYGSGTGPPSGPTPLGDTVQNRIERLLQAGQVTTPARCIDAASAAVVAGIDTGGQASGAALGSVVSSDSGLMFMNNVGNLVYFSRPRLAAMPVRWQLGPNLAAGQIPYQFDEGDAGLDTDPQRVQNVIAVTQFDVTGSGASGAAAGSAETSGPLVFAPDASRYPAVLASQEQNGPCEAKTTSYLQDQTLIQAQANWLFDEFGTPQQRVTQLTVRAEAMAEICPDAWLFVLGANVGDVFTASFTPLGQPSFTGTWRISKITSRKIDFQGLEASITIIGDVYTATYF